MAAAIATAQQRMRGLLLLLFFGVSCFVVAAVALKAIGLRSGSGPVSRLSFVFSRGQSDCLAAAHHIRITAPPLSVSGVDAIIID